MHGQRPATFNELEALGDRLSRQIKSVRIKAARGVSVYTDLLGTPSTFAESAGKVAKVNSDEDSIEFGYVSHSELTDVGAHDHPIESIGTPTYDDFQDWLNIIQSAGRISGGEITENAAHNGTIDVAAGTGFIKTSDSAIGTTKSFDWDADTGIALTDNQINYVYMDYNGGAPVIGVTTDRNTLDGRTEFILGKVYREGTTLHILSYGIRLTELAYNEHERLISVRGFERASGGEISETGQRYLTSGAGVFYFGLNRITTSAQDTSGADRFTYWYRDGGGGWTKVTGQQQIDNTHYDDGSGALATLTANRYGVHWVYIHFDSDINVVYGQGNYKLAEAENAVLPDTVPELVSDFGVLAAKIVVQKSGTNLLTVKSAYKELFPTTFPPKLGDLTDVNAETPNDNDVLSWDAGTNRWIAVTGGVSGFIGLSDTPANYAGSAGYFLRVNATPDAVEFRSPAQVLSDLSGQAGSAFSWNDKDLTSVGSIENSNFTLTYRAGDHATNYTPSHGFRRARGTVDSPNAVLNGDYLGQFYFTGYDGSAWRSGWNGGAGVISFATENWSSTQHGSAILFRTTANGSTYWSSRLIINHNGFVAINHSYPDTILDINGAFTFRKLSVDPSDPDEGSAVLWMSDGTGSGDDGDIMMKITAGAVTKTITLVDFSAA